MSELKACPFCGKNVARIIGVTNEYWVLCTCGVSSGTKNDGKNAIDHWSLRPIEDALSKRVEELERTVDDLRGELAQSDRASDATRIAELEAERAKLREALEQISKHPCGVITDAGSMKKIAQEALKGGE